MSFPTQIGWQRGDSQESLLEREWLVTNGLGGYASGTIGGAATRRFHGKLIAALPSPLGRFMMLNHLEESIETGSGVKYRLSGDEHGRVAYPESDFLEQFVLECGMPVWRYRKNGIRIEKRVVMPHLQNTTYIVYKLLEGPDDVTLHLRPSLRFRPHEGLVNEEVPESWDVRVNDAQVEISDGRGVPPLRLILVGAGAHLVSDPCRVPHVIYRIERSRGYEHEGPLWSPGYAEIPLRRGQNAGLIASVEEWDIVRALSTEECFDAESVRRHKLLEIAGGQANDNFAAQLILAADQFLVRPGTRAADTARVAALGDEPRTVIAGYHWFTDWGRDTMISLEGLTLSTRRYREAGNILRTFASYIRDGLIPNMFPEGDSGGLYHTADASMWFFHAVSRYVKYTNDRETLRQLLPKMIDIIDHHVRGTKFNIHVDPADGLLAQGAEGYQLTWMDAKVDGWVVTPRRGKAVEINALYYNALRVLQSYLAEEGDAANARRMEELALRARTSFNARFWNEETQCLFDVVDTEGGGNDPAIRPNQIFSVSLPNPVLDESRWRSVVDVVRRKLLTPVGLRSLSKDHRDYKERYDGDLRARDAAYHQGTVWGWLIGPFIDAWLRVNPGDFRSARGFLSGFERELGDSCIGTISEVFDAEPPYHARGCAAQAWSVAEVLRCVRAVRGD